MTNVFTILNEKGEKVVDVKYVNKSPHPDPFYKKVGDSGFDLRAWLTDDTKGLIHIDENEGKKYIIIAPLERVLIHTGIYVDLPQGVEMQIRPRSGIALERGLGVLNTPGTIDSNYTGELCIITVNLSNKNLLVYDGERIAQGVICPVFGGWAVILTKVGELDKETERGADGFNSTGTD